MIKIIYKNRKNQRGVAMLLLVMILTSVGLIIASSIFFFFFFELDMGYTYQCGEEAFSVVDGCIEETLRRLKIEPGYNGGSLELGNGNCIIGISGDETNKIINATSTVGSCSKRIQTAVSINNNLITVNSWLEK